MALVDDVYITVKAGDGGRGADIFKTVSGKQGAYPDGGNGGNGGSVYFQASDNISDLSQFSYQKKITAENGLEGKSRKLHGRNGQDTYITVPPGTKIFDENEEEIVEILQIDTPVLIASGGRGGVGSGEFTGGKVYNSALKEGKKGQILKLHLVLSLIADIGLVGFPNAGKSSLLDNLTNAHPKIGNYPFTTLEPNLGVLNNVILADIPGLLEGASKGRGLGTKFLKHIEKTKMLFHCIEVLDTDPVKTYQTLRHEFEEHNPALIEKEEIILITKIDLVDKDSLERQIKKLEVLKKVIIPVSIYHKETMDILKSTIEKLKKDFDKKNNV